MTRVTAPPSYRRDGRSVEYMEPFAPGQDDNDVMTKHLVEFLQANVKPGQEATVAGNRSLNAVLVYIDGALALSCSMDDLLSGPGGSQN